MQTLWSMVWLVLMVLPAQYGVTHEGWVGVTTYNDTDGNLRVKKETLVAMSGITTASIAYPTNFMINGLQ